MRNELFEIKTYISLDIEPDVLWKELSSIITQNLYSYFVGRKKEDIFVKVVTSKILTYNTIPYNEAIETIFDAISDYILTLSNVNCICFKQPPLEMMIKLYQPMIQRMARRINESWRNFEYDDLVGMANYVIVKLYKKGYYLHKSLIWTSLNNEVLMQNRIYKSEPIVESLYDNTKRNVKSDSEELTYADLMRDESYIEEEEKQDEQQLEMYIFEQVKEIIIEKIGVRQWDQLWRDYGRGHTTNSTQATMRRMRTYFKELGLTKQDFINMYRR